MAFVRESRLAKQRVYGALKGADSLGVYVAVLATYPDVNARWLLMGSGNESRTDDPEPAGTAPSPPRLCELGRRVCDLVATHGDTVRWPIEGFIGGLRASLEVAEELASRAKAEEESGER